MGSKQDGLRGQDGRQGDQLKEKCRDKEWMDGGRFIQEVKSVVLGDQLSVEIEKTGQSRMTT